MSGKLPCGRPIPTAAAGTTDPPAAKLDRWRAQLGEYLTAHGLKFSEPRWKIAKRILGARRHLSASDIVREVQRAYPEIGAATVYRSIKVLCDAKVLRETLVDAGGRVVYEVFEEDHHDHIVCLDCGAIFEFHDSLIEARQERIAETLHFTPVSHRHVIYARCNQKKVK